MSDTVTFDNVWKMFQEMKIEAEKDRIEAEKGRIEAEKGRIEAEKGRIEAEKGRIEAEKGRIETARIFREMGTETDRRMQETDRRVQETDKRIRNLSKEIGSLGSKWGEFVENMVAPACETLFAKRGIPVHQIHPSVKAKLDGGRNMEVDVLVVNRDVSVVVEVKSTLTVSDVQNHIEHLKQFKDFFPQYKDYRVLGAVAGMRVDENVENLAKKEGLFVIAQSGDTVILKNDRDFKPHSW